jgi:NTP pyrophosphatase (non-canonical NTP hydrolase)
MTINDLLPLLDKEMKTAYYKYGPYHNSHEQYAVLQEEVDEWFDAIKANISESCQYELLQIAAVALRFIIENGDAESIAEVQRLRYRE